MQVPWEGIKAKDRLDGVTGQRLGEEMVEWTISDEANLLELCSPVKERGTEKEFEGFIKEVLEMAWGRK